MLFNSWFGIVVMITFPQPLDADIRGRITAPAAGVAACGSLGMRALCDDGMWWLISDCEQAAGGPLNLGPRRSQVGQVWGLGLTPAQDPQSNLFHLSLSISRLRTCRARLRAIWIAVRLVVELGRIGLCLELICAVSPYSYFALLYLEKNRRALETHNVEIE
jgi:hypothetical protein